MYICIVFVSDFNKNCIPLVAHALCWTPPDHHGRNDAHGGACDLDVLYPHSKPRDRFALELPRSGGRG